MDLQRRRFVTAGAWALGAAAVVGAPSLVLIDLKKNPDQPGIKEVSPVEDLMREHGGLNRILLIYEEGIRRIDGRIPLDYSLIGKGATLVHDFIEGYHEKLEEDYLFPRLQKAGRLVDLVNVLKAQHNVGRRLTHEIREGAMAPKEKLLSSPDALAKSMGQFVRMYRPHEAREDTIVFPEFKKIVTPREYDELGERFEEQEQKLFGKEGFDGVIAKIAEIEKALGINDLAEFTPKAG
jgi:hemerythrin-like domain-containing protein